MSNPVFKICALLPATTAASISEIAITDTSGNAVAAL